MTESRGFEGQLESDRYCETLLKSTVGNADSTHSTKVFSEDSLQHSEALQFMRGIMDEFTHLKNYDVPVDPGTYYKHLLSMSAILLGLYVYVFRTQGMLWGKGFQTHVHVAELIIIVAAEHDAYMPRDGITALPEIWPGSKLRFIDGSGHVASYLFKQSVFRQAIYDAVDLYCQKYPTKSELPMADC